MSWQAVARKDFQDAVRSRWLWVLTALFVVVFAAPALLIFGGGLGNAPRQGSGSSDAYLFLMKQGTSILVPLISIVVAYASITRERESGTLKLLLSLPHSRDDVVFGKVLGRSAVVGLSILVGVVVTAVALVVVGLQFKIVNYLVFVLLTLLLGLVFVGFATGVSAVASTSRRAMVVSTGVYMFMVVLWNAFANQVAELLKKGLDVGTAGQLKTVLFIKLLNPTAAYKTLLDTALLGSQFNARITTFSFFTRQPAANAIGKPLPVYYGDIFVAAYMLVWLFVPVAVGYLVFRDAEL
ncbi:ABC transporter permease [Halomicrococcus sp. NG-SE-24]|uniref:ABC transporter permease n=1 Tax=Halomicrococcus sp. NG-SE-24 TaxID=3436928 RepID=UPI003D999B7A